MFEWCGEKISTVKQAAADGGNSSSDRENSLGFGKQEN